MASKLPPPPSANHVVTGPPKGVVGGNRKKQKRRAKQAAKTPTSPHASHPAGGQHADFDYDEDPLGYGDEDEYDYSDADAYNGSYLPPHAGPNGYSMPPPPSGVGRNKKKKGNPHHHSHSAYNPELLGNDLPPLPHPPPLPSDAMHHVGTKTIWNTSTQQERQNIKDFWLSLSEEERKSLLKIEKEAVLRKMKQQQKHSCSCTVCGRKRTAIEEELEVLYEGYYEELEQYAHHDHPPLPTVDGLMPEPLQHRPPHPLAVPPPLAHHRSSQMQEHFDDDEEYSGEDEEEEEYSDDEYSEEELEHPPPPRNGVVEDLFGFGESLTVKGILTPWLEKLRNGLKGNADNLLTVADDLLKNDGRKFIEMMEQLAERRMARENQAEYDAANPSHPGAYPPDDPGYNNEDGMAAGDEYDDDEASYDSQEYDDEDELEEDEMVCRRAKAKQCAEFLANLTQGGLTEEQRVKEGKRMFQIFAARMFEQRVLTAYKEKVARERQQKLLEELEDETKLEAQREAKKQRDAEKKKAKKKQQQASKAEEKAKKDAEKAAEEAKLREIEDRKLEEQRLKKEEQRRKKEEGKRKQMEELQKKEAEKLRQQQEQQQRKEEENRKAQEKKAAAKAAKEADRKLEREKQETERALAEEEKAKKAREAKAKADREAKEKERSIPQATQPPAQLQKPPQIAKRPSQAGFVAVPPVLQKQTSSAISSPRPAIATPAIPKAPTPARQRQPSRQGSHASSPKQAQSQISSAPSKSSSPGSAVPQQPQQPPIGPPKTIMQKPGNQQSAPHPPHGMPPMSPHHQQAIQPPPGMQHLQHPHGFASMPPVGFGQFPGPQGPMMHGNMGQRGPMPMYPPHGGPPMGMPNNRFGLSGVNGLPQSPPGMLPQQGRGMGFPFDGPGPGQPPPGFGPHHMIQPNQLPPIGQPPVSAAPGGETARAPVPTHSRQQSSSDKDRFESAANQPIARPAPIQRPSSVKPQNQERRGSNTDIDDLSKALGSSALLDDSDEPINSMIENRRASALPSNSIGSHPGNVPFGTPPTGFGAPGWNTQPFGPTPTLSQQSWGTPMPSAVGSWANNNAAFAANSAFGPIGGAAQIPRRAERREVTIRRAVCDACKQLSASSRQTDIHHPVQALLHQIELNRPFLDSPPTILEMRQISETFADSQNGGGDLDIREDGDGTDDNFAIRWQPKALTPDVGRGGVIGSPLPAKSSLGSPFAGAPGMGRGGGGGAFQSLGAVASTRDGH